MSSNKPLSEKENVTIEDIKPDDRENGYPLHAPRWLTRTLEIVPGVITWTLLLLPFLAAFFNLSWVIVGYVSFLTVYWSFRGIRFAYGIVVGYYRYKRDLARDWIGDIKKLDIPEEEMPRYVYICPIVKEDMNVLGPSFEKWANQTIDPSRISVVFALEEKYTSYSMPVVQELMDKYEDIFDEMSIEVHPFGIEGEVVGVKGGNINWATRNFYKKLQNKGKDPKDYLLITCDSDLVPDEKYLAAITYKYLTVEKPDNKYYCTAVHTFNNNLWRVPPLNRIFAHSLTLAIMHSWVVTPSLRETWSSYVVNLETVHKVGYWDPTVGIDDTPFYWNARIRLQNDFKGVEIYVPTHNDAVENESFVKSHQALYKQQLRWGWGIVVFPITVASLYKNKTISFFEKALMFGKLFHNQLLFLTVIYTITFATPILQTFSSQFKYSAASTNLVEIMRFVLTTLMLLNIPVYIARNKLSPKPEGWSITRHILDILEIILITVNMLTFGFIPKIHAQTLMMFNKFTKKHYVTDKVAIKKDKTKKKDKSK